MRRISYAGSVLVTTDDVADALLRLAVVVANFRQTERVQVPIVGESPHDAVIVDLLIGAGISLLSTPAVWQGAPPDFSSGAETLRTNSYFPIEAAVDDAGGDDPRLFLDTSLADW